VTSVSVMAPVHSRDSREAGHSLEAHHSLEARHSLEVEGSHRAQVEGRSQVAGHHSQVAEAHSREVAHTARSVRRSGDLPVEELQQSWGGGQPPGEDDLRSLAHSPVAGTRLEAGSQLEPVGLQGVDGQAAPELAPVRRDRNQLPLEEAAHSGHSVQHMDLLPDEGAPAHGVDRHWAVHRKQVVEPADGAPRRGPAAEVVHHMESFVGHNQEELHHKQEEGTWQRRLHQAANAENHSATQGLPLLLPPNNAEGSTAR